MESKFSPVWCKVKKKIENTTLINVQLIYIEWAIIIRLCNH